MHRRYAQIIIDISYRKLDRPFTYKVPDSLRGSLRLGSLVRVPFGAGNKEREGYIVGFTDHADYPDERIKEILGIAITGSEVTGANAIRLAAWMRERYGGTMATAMKTVVPARKDYQPARTRAVCLVLPEDEARERLAAYERKHQVARARLLQELLLVPRQPYSLILQKLHVTAQTMRAMEAQGVIRIEVTTSLRNPVTLEDVEESHIALSDEQQAIVDGVIAAYDANHEERTRIMAENAVYGKADPLPRIRPALLHGITGSGKTEVYIGIIESIVARGAQAIMLIPEISLTYQTLIRFYRHFGERVSVMNSTLSEGEKSDQFERARRGEIDVIIGPRSALYTPFPRIGVIVIDEEHEGSYKNEQMPKYHARDVAEEIAAMHGAALVLGSATPSLSSYYRAQTGVYDLYTLDRRLTGGRLPDTEIADLREEMRQGNRSILSRRLRTLLEDRLARHEQTMLFLNRRGYSGFVSCRSCGHVIKCPHCDVSLSLHGRNRLVCHYCGYETAMVQTCPECGSPYIAGLRAGTEQIEQYLHKEYPEARILRMDADTTRQKGSYDKILSAFQNEEADILIGTQMIVKGHDFPKVTLVGILLADMSLGAGDYRAAERTFSLLTQAAGRAGRGTLPGNVVIQTYEPEHYAIRHAAAQDYQAFYEEEIHYRQALLYPPVWSMLAVEITGANEDHVIAAAAAMREVVADPTQDILVIGPASAAIPRLRDEYRYALYIKCAKYDTLIGCKDSMESYVLAGNIADDVRIQFDFNPMNAF